jgi:hypothetical protein
MQGKGFEPQFTGMIIIDRQRYTPVGFILKSAGVQN